MVKKIKEWISNIVNWYSELTGVKKLYVSIIGVGIIALLAIVVSKVNFEKKAINYKEINDSFISSLNVNYDKEVYIKCDTAIKRLIYTYYDNYKLVNEEIDLDDFYKFAKEWEYNISKSKFKKTITNIVTELQTEKNASIENIETFYPIIKNIYTYSDTRNMYFIEFETNERHIVGLHFTEGRFYIFYLE